jgi:hypothetical protein
VNITLAHGRGHLLKAMAIMLFWSHVARLGEDVFAGCAVFELIGTSPG